jgi:hypothetical protein
MKASKPARARKPRIPTATSVRLSYPALNGHQTIGEYVRDFERANSLILTDVSHLDVPISREWC